MGAWSEFASVRGGGTLLSPSLSLYLDPEGGTLDAADSSTLDLAKADLEEFGSLAGREDDSEEAGGRVYAPAREEEEEEVVAESIFLGGRWGGAAAGFFKSSTEDWMCVCVCENK